MMRDEVDKAQRSIRKLSKEEWLALLRSDIDPLVHAGEGISDTEEIPIVAGIKNPYLRARVGREDEYYPGAPKRKRK